MRFNIEHLNIDHIDFPKDHYESIRFPKDQIVLHFTLSKGATKEDSKGDRAYWIGNFKTVSCPLIFAQDGDITRLFSTSFWANHLGVKQKHFDAFGLRNFNQRLNQRSIALELDSFGPLILKNGKYYSMYGHLVDPKDVQFYEVAYRGYHYYEKVSTQMLKSLSDVLLYLGDLYNIPLNYNPEMWDVSKEALLGYKGIWSHSSFRPDKSDMHPQPELIEMLKSLDAIASS